MKKPPDRIKNALRRQPEGAEPGQRENLQGSVIIHPPAEILTYRVPRQERHGFEVFACTDGRVRIRQTIDGVPRTISLVLDEAEVLADRLPTAIETADAKRWRDN